MTRELVALDMTPGADFVAALQRAWDDGNAVLPIDQRLPQAAKKLLIASMGAAYVASDDHPDPTPTANDAFPTEGDDAVVVATSGTTGQPKGVVLTHSAVGASAILTSQALAVDPARHHWLACLPLAHIGGLSVVTRALHTSTPLTVHPTFDAVACENAARSGATHVSLVVAALGRIDATLFEQILLGGSAIPPNRPANTVATYGMTETGSGIVYDGWPLPGVELRIEDGEIHIKSPTLLRCYRDGSSPIDTNGWYRTGDAGEVNTQGKLSVQGRIGDVIVTGAEKVWPVAVERAMSALSWVAEVAVIGMPDPEWGHTVVAAVVPTPGATVPSLAETRDQLSEELPRYAQPRRLHVVDQLPKTAIGKVQRSALIAELTKAPRSWQSSSPTSD